MPDLIHQLTAAGLSEDQARTACRVVAEWVERQTPPRRGSDFAHGFRSGVFDTALAIRSAGDAP